MKPWQWILIAVVVAAIILAFYAVSKAQQAPVIVKQGAKEPEANVWSVVGGLINLFGKGDDKNGSTESPQVDLGEASSITGPPTQEDWMKATN